MITRYRHFYDHTTHEYTGAVTVALIIDEDTNISKMGIAVCSPNDQFSRSIGRAISYYRTTGISGRDMIEFEYDSDMTITENIMKVFDEYPLDGEHPKLDELVLSAIGTIFVVMDEPEKTENRFEIKAVDDDY